MLLFVISSYLISGIVVSSQLSSAPIINVDIGPPPSAPWDWPGYIAGILGGFMSNIFSLISYAFQVATFSFIPIWELRMLLTTVFGILFLYSVLPVIEKIVELIVEAIPL